MRKAPRQARSRATVEAIIEGGTQVLGRRGWSGFTTNEVAEVAGVSIGSLYQYFPDKLALVDTIRGRHFEDVLQVVRGASRKGQTLTAAADALARGLFAIHRASPSLHRALLEDVPRTRALRALHEEFEREYLQHYTIFIAQHRRGSARRRGDIAARVLASAVEGIVHDAVRRDAVDASAVIRELVTLICAYIASTPDAIRRKSPASSKP